MATSYDFMWVLDGEPRPVTVVDKDGVERTADLDRVRALNPLNPYKVAGPFGHGVGNLFFGGKLGSVKELKEKGNSVYNNETILSALGFVKKMND